MSAIVFVVLFVVGAVLANFHNFRSPLDATAFDEYGVGSDLSSFGSPDGSFSMLPDGVFASDLFGVGLQDVASCRQLCTTKFAEVIKFAIRSPNHYERFENVCNRYNDTVRCMDESNAVCFNQQPFNVFTSGLYYMCIEQRKAFEAVIECIDAQAAEVQQECDDKCQTKGKMASWAVHSGILDNLINQIVLGASNGVAGFTRDASQRRFNPEFARRLIQDGCDLAQCQLACVKLKFNTRCHHNAGALLSEALVRPLAETQKVLGLTNMQGILNMFMPRQCEFILSTNTLNKYRIDPTLNENIKRHYENDAEKDAAVAARFNMTSIEEMNDVIKRLETNLINSPFDENAETPSFDKFGENPADNFGNDVGDNENKVENESNADFGKASVTADESAPTENKAAESPNANQSDNGPASERRQFIRPSRKD